MLRLTPDIEEHHRCYYLVGDNESVWAVHVTENQAGERIEILGLPLPKDAAILQHLSWDDILRYDLKVLSYDDTSTSAAAYDTYSRWQTWREAGRPPTFPPSSAALEAKEIAEKWGHLMEASVQFGYSGEVDFEVEIPAPPCYEIECDWRLEGRVFASAGPNEAMMEEYFRCREALNAFCEIRPYDEEGDWKQNTGGDSFKVKLLALALMRRKQEDV